MTDKEKPKPEGKEPKKPSKPPPRPDPHIIEVNRGDNKPERQRDKK